MDTITGLLIRHLERDEKVASGSMRFIRVRIFFAALEIIGGLGTAVLGVAIVFRIHSISVAAGTSTDFTRYMSVILMFIAPAVVVLVGSYLQAKHDKQWAFVLVIIGGIYNLSFVGLIGRFAFGYIADALGQFLVWTDLGALTITLGAAFINLIMSLVFVSGKYRMNK